MSLPLWYCLSDRLPADPKNLAGLVVQWRTPDVHFALDATNGEPTARAIRRAAGSLPVWLVVRCHSDANRKHVLTMDGTQWSKLRDSLAILAGLCRTHEFAGLIWDAEHYEGAERGWHVTAGASERGREYAAATAGLIHGCLVPVYQVSTATGFRRFFLGAKADVLLSENYTERTPGWEMTRSTAQKIGAVPYFGVRVEKGWSERAFRTRYRSANRQGPVWVYSQTLTEPGAYAGAWG